MKDLSWKVLSSSYLFKDLWFTVRKDKCVTPEGTVVDPYYVYEFPTWVTVVALTEDNKVITVRQYRHALGETLMEIPGGCVDDTDTSLEEAAARELLEETGYVCDQYDYLGKISANPSTNNNIMHMYLARNGKKIKEQTLDHNEEIEVYLLTIDEIKALLKSNQILQAMHATCLFYALNKLEEMSY
ncbi:MAG: NUDIX hydrolase [Terrimonas sp.]|nr:NUDIX hydrolase [Terrimonas sp.]OJY88711.1 MAG: DNA mismatch repair protein MutT [Sphingobacteriales bacterium 40-81]